MANLSSVTKYFPIAKEGFTTTVESTVAPGDTTVSLNSVTGYSNGDTVVLVVEPGDVDKKQVFTGIVDTSGVQITNVVWTEGSNSQHLAGSTVADYATATHMSMVSKGLLVSHNHDGTLIGDAVRDALGVDAAPPSWNLITSTLSTASGYNQGNRSFEIDTSDDLTSVLSPGMRFKIDRDTAAPTQCADLEASSSQYASKSSPTGITFTDDFTCEAWVKLESYGNGTDEQAIVSRLTGAPATGFVFRINEQGAVEVTCGSASNTDTIESYQSIPLNQWVHVAASIDLSTDSFAIYIDGVSVPITTDALNLNSITQSGNLQVGAMTASDFFDGKISDVRVWSTVRNATEIRDNMNQQLTGSETGLVGYWKLDGDWNDSTANANHLTPVNSPIFATDNPMKDTEYGIITKVEPYKITVFTGTDHTIPNMTLTNPYYSTQKVPFGFPAERDKWTLEMFGATEASAAPTGSYVNLGGYKLEVPLGSWILRHKNTVAIYDNPKDSINMNAALSTSATAMTDRRLHVYVAARFPSGAIMASQTFEVSAPVTLTAPTNYYSVVSASSAYVTIYSCYGSGSMVIAAECAYL